jgi:sugar lactone lactonase YvrE
VNTDSVELVIDARATLGEGPVWDSNNQVLYWVDIVGEKVHRFDPRSALDNEVEVGQPVGSLAIRARGGLVLALREGFGLLNLETNTTRVIADLNINDPDILMNDGKCDPKGRFWAGSQSWRGRPRVGALYRLEHDHRVTRILDDVTCSNGLDWSTDGKVLYYIDSPAGGIDTFDFNPQNGDVHNRRRLVDIPSSEGLADGMTVDADGHIWVAVWDGWSIRRYDPDGRLTRVIDLPVARVTSCTFGGPDLADLYITTARSGLTPEQLQQQPLAGGVFRCRPGPRGRAPSLYLD